MMDYGKNQALNPQGGWGLYSNSYFFCSTCVMNVPPAIAIKSFFNVQNALDMCLFLGFLYSRFGGSSSSTPKRLLQSGGGIANVLIYIVYVFYLQIIALIGGFILSILARSELNVIGAKGSWPVGKTKLALLLYMIYLIINVVLFAIIFLILISIAVFSGSQGGQAGAAGGIFATIIALMFLPFALLETSQLIQCIRMKNAASEIEGTGQMNSTM